MARRRVGPPPRAARPFVPSTDAETTTRIGAAHTKYGAERCLVALDGTITTETEIHALAALRGTIPASMKRLTLAELAHTLGLVGAVFPSLKEGRRYIQLRALERLGQIEQLHLQPAYALHVARPVEGGGYEPVYVGTFTADFTYLDLTNGELVVEDTKSDFTRTTAYQLRKRMTEAEYGITIREL